MLYTQYKTHEELDKNRLRFHCFVCGGAERTISARFLKREAKYKKATFVLRWVDIGKYWKELITITNGVNEETHKRYRLFLQELDKHYVIDNAFKIAIETKPESLPSIIFEKGK